MAKTTKQKRDSRRGKHKMWSQESMTMALAEIRDNLISIRGASKKYNIPRDTIQDRIHERVQDSCEPGRKQLIDAKDEKKLLDYASNRASMGVGFSKSNFMRYLYYNNMSFSM